jgi:hypothetical protein
MATAGLGGILHLPHADVRHLPAKVAHVARSAWFRRACRPWRCVVAVPLAMTAAAQLGLWWTWPILVFLAAWWSPWWRWAWVLALEEAIISSEWAYVGISALREWPHQRASVEVLWIAFPLLLACVGWRARLHLARR